MEITYLQDIPLPPPEEWPEDALLDPLHPGHGPLPNLFGRLVVQTQDPGVDLFDVALWDVLGGFITMVERQAEEDPDPEAPMFSIEEAHARGGWIARTFLWKVGEGARAFICGPARVLVPSIPSRVEYMREWSQLIYRGVMVESVRLTITNALGVEVLEVFKKLRQLAPR